MLYLNITTRWQKHLMPQVEMCDSQLGHVTQHSAAQIHKWGLQMKSIWPDKINSYISSKIFRKSINKRYSYYFYGHY